MAEGLDPLPNVFSALQSQLGLKLERKPTAVEVFVVDHMGEDSNRKLARPSPARY